MNTIKRGGKRANAGRPKSELTKMLRVPVGALDAIESFIRLYKNTQSDIDYVQLNIAIARTEWCLERGDFTDTREIKKVILDIRKNADELDKTKSDDYQAGESWAEAERLEALANEYEKIVVYGIDN